MGRKDQDIRLLGAYTKFQKNGKLSNARDFITRNQVAKKTASRTASKISDYGHGSRLVMDAACSLSQSLVIGGTYGCISTIKAACDHFVSKSPASKAARDFCSIASIHGDINFQK